MIFNETPISGAYLIEPKKIEDHRGYFTRIWCENELKQHGLKTELAQANAGFSRKKGTLRGLHFQADPNAEVKLVRCTRGAMFDVIVDLRPFSPSYKKWFGTELSEENSRQLYVPEGCAQGYITLMDDTEMCYQTSQFYRPESASGVRFDDPEFGIVWPVSATTISDQDGAWPNWASRDQQLFSIKGAGQ
jgi:dTDP-4-dehydrorhamnose 3,5-epimerase